MGAELTMSPVELLAGIVNARAGDTSASASTMSEAALIGAWYVQEVGGAPNPHLRLSVPAMLAAIHNAVSDAADLSATTSSVETILAGIRNALSDDPDTTVKASSTGQLLAQIYADLTVSEGGSVPAWVEALRAPSGDLPVFAADFRNGRYWNTDAECDFEDLLAPDVNWGNWNPAELVPGFGLLGYNEEGSNGLVFVPAQAAVLAASGFTAMVEVYAPLGSVSTYGNGFVVVAADLPDYNFYIDVCGRNVSEDHGGPVQAHLTLNSGTVVTANTGGDGPGTTRTAGTNLISSGAISTLGGAVATGTDEDPATGLNTLGVYASVGDASDPVYMALAVVYPPQPNADLPAMSAL